MSATIPLLQGFAATDPVLWPVDGRQCDPLDAARLCGVARQLALELPASRYAINCCEDPARFMLASAAALIGGRTLVLPHTRAAFVEEMLVAHYPDACALTDTNPFTNAVHVPDPFEDCEEETWPPPEVPVDHETAILFTSGSTGAPSAHGKRWSSLVRGAETFRGAFGPIPRSAVILGTVAAQHMFGLETTLLVPWQCGIPLARTRPLYPLDLAVAARALTKAGRDVWLLTTPLHLRAFHAALEEPPVLERIIVSTMPLHPALARDVERDWNVPVEEIFGCTEGGMLASRRPSSDERFVPAPGLHFDIQPDGATTVSGGQLDLPLLLADSLACSGDGQKSFTLVGRSGDVVKVAGKRVTFAELNAALLSIHGVADGAFVMLDGESERLAAIVVAPGHDEESLRRALGRRVDRAFLPRPLLFARSLPRDTQGKLPLAALHRAAKEASANRNARPDRFLAARVVVPPEHPALPGHFPGKPLVPGVVLLERVEALLRTYGIAIAELLDARFAHPVLPGVELSIDVDLVDGASASFRIRTEGVPAASGRLHWRLAQ